MQVRATFGPVGRVLHVVAMLCLAGAALAALAATALSALDVLPWISLSAGLGGAAHPQAGMVAQVGGTTLLCLLVAFLPANSRMLALERSHRDFRMTMTDVANAYHAAHMADRKGAFTLSSEFDQVRERIEYLRAHPDLKLLEADVLTVAAQMSQQSHRLAQLYAEPKVTRARDFLAQRQHEAEDQQARIAQALQVCREIMRWTSQVELAEATVASQLQQLEEQLEVALPALGLRLDAAWRPDATSGQVHGEELEAHTEDADTGETPDNVVTLPVPGPLPMSVAQ